MSNKSSLFAENENDLFYFESDHLALRGNKDYCEVLKTLVTLSAKREKLLKDYKKVLEIRKIVLENPQVILEKIRNKEDLGLELPPRIYLPSLPVVNFDKYGVTVPQPILKEIYSDYATGIKVEEDPKKEKHDQRTWTIEEQKRLEELLLLYPPEPIERKRYQKIAKALGNRTLAQVTSRVQKYFLKLYKAGLPIPGRMPKSVKNNNRKSALHKHQRFNHYLWKPTTFFPEFSIPVTMDDSEHVPGPSSSAPPPASNPHNYLLPTEYRRPTAPQPDTQEVRDMKIALLKRIKAEKMRLMKEAPFHHIKYTCAHCEEWPILGAVWHCYRCPGNKYFCTDCAAVTTLRDLHPVSHPLLVYTTDDESVARSVVLTEEDSWYPQPKFDFETVPGPSSAAPPSASIPGREKNEFRARVELLKRITAERARVRTEAPFHHVGYACSHCKKRPIVGAVWHCYSCPEDRYFCTDCAWVTTFRDLHPVSHPLAVYTDDESEARGAVPSDEDEWHPQSRHHSDNNVESDSTDTDTKNKSENDSSDSDATKYGGGSNLEALVKSEPAAKNKLASASRVGEEMELWNNSVSWSDDEDSVM